MTAKIKTISYADLVNALLANLSDREQEVLQKRNALADYPKHTLEQIGKDFNITRERVRQIEREGLKKIKNMDYDRAKLPVRDLESIILDYLKSHGGIMAEWHLQEKLLQEQLEVEEKALNFILANIFAGNIKRVVDLNDHHVVFALQDVDLDQAVAIASALKELIENHGKPLHLEDLSSQFQSHKYYDYIKERQAEDLAILEALLSIRQDLNRNILGQWGVYHWNTIKPKRMTDKAYLVMLRENRPLHFEELAELINQANFDRKKAHPATVHNELILDDKYVLVGRGIYALREWGYQEGTVADIIENILKNNGPMSKKELAEEVLKQRLVQKTTITLVLMNKDKFKRLENGRYELI
ncbi:MAG: hypothetical protein GF365_04565 [Candidatus Buchananbacteria bacterium]|nr:hypothetical protein [Candidatus Buchananbacteria bacterium]